MLKELINEILSVLSSVLLLNNAPRESHSNIGKYLYEKYYNGKIYNSNIDTIDSLKQGFYEKITKNIEFKLASEITPYIVPYDEAEIEKKYGKDILNLAIALDKEGYDIFPYLFDSRFKIYNDIKKLRKSYNNIKLSAEQYKKNIDYFVRENLQDNVNFIMQNEKILWETAIEYKSDPFIIATVLNIESGFGKKLGKRIALNSWISIYNLFPKDRHARLNAFKQIKALLDFSVESNRDIFDIKGSFMGCIGLCQTLPDNIKKFGIDYNKDGIIDPFSLEDACAFIANYIKEGTEKQIHSYNPSKIYVDKVRALADATKKEYAIRKEKYNSLFIRNYSLNAVEKDKTNLFQSYSF